MCWVAVVCIHPRSCWWWRQRDCCTCGFFVVKWSADVLLEMVVAPLLHLDDLDVDLDANIDSIFFDRTCCCRCHCATYFFSLLLWWCSLSCLSLLFSSLSSCTSFFQSMLLIPSGCCTLESHSGCCTPWIQNSCWKDAWDARKVPACCAWGNRRWNIFACELLLELLPKMMWTCCWKVVAETEVDLLTGSSCCSRSCHQSSCCSQRGSCVFFDVGQQGGVETGFPDVPVKFAALTLLTTITVDDAVPHLVEKCINDELCLVDVVFLLVVVVGVVIVFNLLVVLLLFNSFFSLWLS